MREYIKNPSHSDSYYEKVTLTKGFSALKNLEKAGKAGVTTPMIYELNTKEMKLKTEPLTERFESTDAFIRRNQQDQAQLDKLFGFLGEALGVLHNAGILHGNLDHERILVNKEGLKDYKSICFTSFGLSTTSNDNEDKAADIRLLGMLSKL